MGHVQIVQQGGEMQQINALWKDGNKECYARCRLKQSFATQARDIIEMKNHLFSHVYQEKPPAFQFTT